MFFSSEVPWVVWAAGVSSEMRLVWVPGVSSEMRRVWSLGGSRSWADASSVSGFGSFRLRLIGFLRCFSAKRRQTNACRIIHRDRTCRQCNCYMHVSNLGAYLQAVVTEPLPVCNPFKVPQNVFQGFIYVLCSSFTDIILFSRIKKV